MMGSQTEVVVINDELAEFIESGLSIQVAASDARGLATLARGYGAFADRDRGRVRVLLARSQCGDLLHNIGANGRIAVLLNEPETHRTLQLKGRDALIAEPSALELASIPIYVQTVTRRLRHFQVPEAFSRALLSVRDDDLVAVGFTPCEAYGQTPGPHAGAPLATGCLP